MKIRFGIPVFLLACLALAGGCTQPEETIQLHLEGCGADGDTSTALDCAALTSGTGLDLCVSGTEQCDVVFDDGSGCTAACASLGLDCIQSYEDVTGVCAPQDAPPLGCADTGHNSDYCVCGTAPEPEPLDCTALSAGTGYELCSSGTEQCDVVFRDGSGCSAACASLGLDCVQSYEDVTGVCAPQDTPPLGCADTGHNSDYCVCGVVSDPGGTPPGGGSGSGTCDPFADPPGDRVIDLGAEGLSEGDLIDSYFDRWVAPGNEVHIPAGRYRWNGSGFNGKSLRDTSVIGDGEVVLDAGDGYTWTATFDATGNFEMRNITIRGRAGDDDGAHDKLRLKATAPDAVLVFRNVRLPDGAVPGGRVGIFVNEDHVGTIYLIDCHVEGFPNNGVYASSPGKYDRDGGPVHVIGGLYRNNNIANVRIGTDDSTIIGVVSIQDAVAGERIDDTYPSGARRQRGIWVREHADNVLIENVDVIQEIDPGNAIVVKARIDQGSGIIRNVRVRNDIGSDAVDVQTGTWSGSDIHVTGSGSFRVDGGSFTDVCTGSGCDTPSSTPRPVACR